MQGVRAVRGLSKSLKQSRFYSSSHDVFKATMNDIPSPQGSWKVNYDKNQQKYNRHLVLGVAILTGTLAFGQYQGYHRMYNDIPEEPAVITSYK